MLLEGYILSDIYVCIPDSYTSREDKGKSPYFTVPEISLLFSYKPTIYRYSQPDGLRQGHLLLVL
jgi:hypothetical protein